MEETREFAPLLLVLLLAFLVPLTLARFRSVPVVVGEILAGVLIGHSGLGLVGENELLDFMSNIGLAFLMFLAGMEMDFGRLFPPRPEREGQQQSETSLLGLVLLVYGLTLALAVPGGFLLNRLGLAGDPWLLAFILSATSLGVVLPVLKTRNLTQTTTGQIIFLSALLADFITVILLTVFLILHENGFNVQLFSLLALFLAFFLIVWVLARVFRLRRMQALIEELSQVTVQIKVRGAIAILMAFVVLAGFLGMELILGAFLAGMAISLLKTPGDTDLVHKLEAFGFGFFIPVFFIMAGVNLDLRALFASPQNLTVLPVFILAALLVKTLPALLFRRRISWPETLGVAALLNTHLSLEIAVTVIGARLGLLTPAATTAAVLFAVLTVFTMPVLFNRIMPAPAGQRKKQMVVFGADDLGIQVAKILERHGETVRLLDAEERNVQRARQAGFSADLAFGIPEAIRKVYQEPVETLLALASEDTRNLLVCRAAAQAGIEHIVALVNDPARLIEYRSLGVTPFAPGLYRPALLASLARSPDVFTLLTSTGDNQDIREADLHNPLAAGEALRSLGLPGSLLVLSIGRNGDLLIPHGNTRLEIGDRLTLVGNAEDAQQAAEWLERSHPPTSS